MREIIFRGKSIKDGQWRQGSLFTADYDGKEAYVLLVNPIIDKKNKARKDLGLEFDENDVDVPIPDSIGQFTGLYDRSGNMIFEGDIVRWDDCSNGKYWRFAVVTMIPDILFDCEPIKAIEGVRNSSNKIFPLSSFIYRDTGKYLDVIGNIVDNPEMTKPYIELKVGTKCPFIETNPRIIVGSRDCRCCAYRTKIAASPGIIEDSSLKIACAHI